MALKRQREIALAAVAAVTLAIAAYQIRSATSGSAQSQTSSKTASAPSDSGKPQLDKSGVAFVNLEALQTVRPEPIDGERNPFRFKAKAAPPVPAVSPAPATMMAPDAVMPAGPPPPPPITLRFISRWESSKTGAIAALSDGKGLVVYGREGEIIEGRYRILKIGVESVDLAYLDGRGRQTIRLGQ